MWGNPSVHVLVGCRDQKKAKSIFRSERAKVGQLFLQGDSLVQHIMTHCDMVRDVENYGVFKS